MADAILTIGTELERGSVSRLATQIARDFNTGSFALGKITGKANEFVRSLDAASARTIAFGATAGSLFALKAGFDKLVGSVVATEKALVEINTLLNLSRGGLSQFSSDLFKVANATGTTFADAAKAAQEFSRQGLGVEATLKRTNSALILTRLSGLSLEDSVSSLTAALNGFGREALTDIDIVNRLANVDAKFAVSSADLAEALKRVSSSASDAGVGFNQIIALVTTAQQVTARGGAVIGNSLKTILTRIQRPQVLDDLAAVGIAIKDLDGKKLPVIAEGEQASVLKNLANSYDSLSSAQKSFVSETVGGVYQINILKSLLGDLGNGFTIYDGAVRAAEQSTASAQKRIEALNNTISSQFIRTLNNLTQASVAAGNILIAPTIRGGANFIDNITKAGTKFNPETGKDELNSVGGTLESVGKGISNILAGPGIQLAVFALLKLFGRLFEFARQSFKEISGLNDKANERAAIEGLVINYLKEEKAILNGLVSGAIDVSKAYELILQKVKAISVESRNIALFVPEITTELQTKGNVRAKPSNSGFIPNLNTTNIDQEIMGARAGGYTPGDVINTSIRNGANSIPAIVNTAETRSTVKVGNKTYEFINPPENSPAGRKHARKALAMTGIDPYELGQNRLGGNAGGFVPNLSDFRYPSHRKNLKENEIQAMTLLRGGGVVSFSSPRTPYLDIDLNQVKNKVNYKDKANFLGLVENISSKAKYRLSGGFLPIIEAVARENKATNGNARLARSPKLISPSNPYGLAAIDKRTQRNADQAIAQHLEMGQTIGEVKRQKSSHGFVPNLAVADQFGISAGLAVLQLIPRDLESFKEVLGKAGKNASGTLGALSIAFGKSGKIIDQEISSKKKSVQVEREWVNATETAIDQIRKGEIKSFRIPSHGSFSSRVIGGDLSSELPEVEKSLDISKLEIAQFEKLKQSRRQSLSTTGLVASIGGGAVGGILSSVTGRNSPDLAAGIDELTTGVVTGGQILATFPNKFGKFAFALSAATGGLNAIDTFTKGIESQRRAFEQSSDKTQKLVSEIGNLINAVNTLDGMYLDSSVTQENLVKTQKRYDETLAKLSATSEEGRKLSAEVRGSANNKERTRRLSEAQELYTKNLEKEAVNLQIKELGAERKFFGLGPGLFGGSNQADKGRSSQILQSAAGSILNSLDKDRKQALVDNVTNKGEFASLLGSNSDFQSISKAIKEAGGGEKGISLLVSQIKLLVGQERLNKDPNVKSAITNQRQVNERGQTELDNEVRNQQNLRKLFINSTAFAGNSIINRQARDARGAFNRFEIDEERAKGIGRVSSLFTDDQTNRSREVGLQGERNKAEFEAKREEITSATNQKLLGLFGQTFEELTKGFNDRANEGGERVPSIDIEKFNQAKGLNEAIVKTLNDTIKTGGIKSLFDKDNPGQLGENFRQAALSNVPADLRDFVSKKLSTAFNTAELQQALTEDSDKLLETMQDFLKKQDVQTEVLMSIENEEKARRGAESFGGLRLLTDPKFAAEQRRNSIRGQVFLNSNDEKLRGRGAALLLEQKQFAGLSIDKNDPLIGIAGRGKSKAVNDFVRQSVIGNNSAGANQARETLKEGAALANANLDRSVKAQFRVRDEDEINKAKESVNKNINGNSLEKLFNDTAARVDSFPRSLEALEKSIKESSERIDQIREINKENNNTETEKVTEALKAAALALGDVPTKLSQINEKFSNSGTGLTTVLKTLGIGIGILAVSKGARTTLKDNTKDLFGASKKGFDSTKNFVAEKLGKKQDFSFKPVGQEKPFSFSGFNAKGKAISGEIKASTIEEAVEKIKKQGNFPVKVRSVAPTLETNVGVKQSRSLPQVPGHELKPNFFNKPESIVPQKPSLSAQQQEGTKAILANRARNEAEKMAKAKELVERQEANVTKSRTQEALKGKPVPNPVLPKNFDFNKIKSGGKNAAITAGILATFGLLTGQANAAEGEDQSEVTKQFGKDILTGTGVSIAGGIAGNAFSKTVLKGKFGGPKGVKGLGAGLGIGLADDLLFSRIAAPEGEGNQYLRTATSFLPPGLNIAGRAGIRAGEAINYQFGGGKLDQLTAISEARRGKFEETYAASTKVLENRREIEKLNSLRSFRTPEGAANRDRVVAGYKAQNDFLTANYDKLKTLTKDELKPLFDDLAKAIDNLRTSQPEKQDDGTNLSSITFPPINIEISVKDVDKLPELFNSKIIEPLEAKLKELKERVLRAETDIGIGPSPSSL